MSREAAQRRVLPYDRVGEEHFNIISALHKCIRGSDPDAGLYWLARMLEAGEDPLYVARRLVRFASEDVGLADPDALRLAVAVKETVHFLGMPEGNTALAQLVVYLALAPKSNSVYTAYKSAARDAKEKPPYPVPLWIRNAPTRLMKRSRLRKGVEYAHDFDDAIVGQRYLPDEMGIPSIGRVSRAAAKRSFWSACNKSKRRRRGDGRSRTATGRGEGGIGPAERVEARRGFSRRADCLSERDRCRPHSVPPLRSPLTLSRNRDLIGSRAVTLPLDRHWKNVSWTPTVEAFWGISPLPHLDGGDSPRISEPARRDQHGHRRRSR